MYTLVCTFSVILSHRLHRLGLLPYLFSWTAPLPHLALKAWLEKDPFFNQSKNSAGCGLVLMLVQHRFDPWTFWEPACFSTSTRATVVSHSSVTVYVSNFPALSGSTMPAHFNSLQVLLLALLAYIGIQTWPVLGPLLFRFRIHSDNRLFVLWKICQNKLQYL